MTPEQLREWRTKAGYTQEGLAELLGVTKTTVYRWEAAMREIPPFLALALECVEKKKGGESKGERATKTKRERS